jgi:hypothetical protein
MTIQPTTHEKAEWSRMAKSAYKTGHNACGHRFSAAAALPNGAVITLKDFDELQEIYRMWLVFNQYLIQETESV